MSKTNKRITNSIFIYMKRKKSAIDMIKVSYKLSDDLLE